MQAHVMIAVYVKHFTMPMHIMHASMHIIIIASICNNKAGCRMSSKVKNIRYNYNTIVI